MSILYSDKTPAFSSTPSAFLDGKKIRTHQDFLQCLGEQLNFPDWKTCNWDAYLDWMRDLSWLTSKEITIVIENYDFFLSDDPQYRQYFVSDLEKVVFPFWQKDAKDVFKLQDSIKTITVYCVSAKSWEIQDTQNINLSVYKNILDGQKIPHRVSFPVIRQENSKYYLAYFVFFFTSQDIENGKVQRPTAWALVDIKTGEIVDKKQTTNKDFSNAPYDIKYDIHMDKPYDTSKQYYEEMFALMDSIRKGIVQNGQFDKKTYQSYLHRILSVTPSKYQRFYTDLSIVVVEEEPVATNVCVK